MICINYNSSPSAAATPAHNYICCCFEIKQNGKQFASMTRYIINKHSLHRFPVDVANNFLDIPQGKFHLHFKAKHIICIF